MIGIVVVSHSPTLAHAAVDLALEMVAGTKPPVAIAAGTADGSTGTDATAVAAAIEAVASPAGVLVIMDLGSAVLSAGLALEFLPDLSLDVRLSAAPFFEGLQSAVVLAAAGASLDEIEREAAGALGAKRAQLSDEAGAPGQSTVPDAAAAPDAAGAAPVPDAVAELTLINADGLHARPAAAMVAAIADFDARVLAINLRSGAGPANVASPIGLASLVARAGDRLRIEANGPDAAAAVEVLRTLVTGGFGEPTSAEPAPPAPATGPAPGPIGVSPGQAAGPAVVMAPAVEEPAPAEPLPTQERVAAAERAAAAAEPVARDLDRLAERLTPPARDIVTATAAVARDPELAAAIRGAILERGLSAERAVWEALAQVAEVYRAGGPRLAARVADLDSVRDRLIAHLTGRPAPGLPQTEEPYVLVAVDLVPTDAAVLDPALCVAIVTEQGGPTSHTAILARSLGIPAIAAAPGVTRIPDGTMLLVDGTSGVIVVDPSPDQLAALGTGADTAAAGPGATADGHAVPLLANVASPDSVAAALDAGAEGVGLFRTEFCFLGRAEAPNLDDQVAAYAPVFAAFAGRKVVVRTLDAGADKPLPFVTAQLEPNPALGVRGYRTAAAHPELLDTQLAAIAAAAAGHGAEVQVMAPMIATPDEAAAFAAACRGHGIATVGVMIETPAAALLAAEILAEVDFVSLGTNDLTQYTMAADRTLGSLAAFGDPWQPSVLRLIRLVCRAADGKPVGVCGEAAADPLLAAVLVGLGVTSLSMAPRSRGPVAEVLARVTLARCRAAADAACSAGTAAASRAAAASLS